MKGLDFWFVLKGELVGFVRGFYVGYEKGRGGEGDFKVLGLGN